MKEVLGVGKNLEQAISNALFELKAIREDVDIKILEQGGFFKKAKVLVSISPDALEKYEKKEKFKEELEKEEQKLEEPLAEAVAEPQAEVRPVEKPERVSRTGKSELETGKGFLEELMATLGIEGKVLTEETSDVISYTIMGDKVGELIGYRGECMNALQYLTSVINSKCGRHTKKVRLDIDGFKEKREATLKALAHRISKKAIKTHHSVKLEPMTAYERRIIHTVVQEYPELESHSEGVEPHRYLIVSLKG